MSGEPSHEVQESFTGTWRAGRVPRRSSSCEASAPIGCSSPVAGSRTSLRQEGYNDAEHESRRRNGAGTGACLCEPSTPTWSSWGRAPPVFSARSPFWSCLLYTSCADRIIDLGPEGGERGGTVVAQGTPEEVAQVEGSYTGAFVKKMLEDGRL